MPNNNVATSRSTRRTRRATERPKRPRRRTTRGRRFRSERRSLGLELQRHSRQLVLPPLGRPQVVSLGVVGVVLALLVYIGISPRFYVYAENVEVVGNRYTTPEEIYAASGVDGYHIFYLHPSEVAQRVAALPYVRQARVSLGLPASVRIVVEERQPVVRWEREGYAYWVDAEGYVMPVMGEAPNLLVVVDPAGSAALEQGDEDARFDPYLLQVLQNVKGRLPEVRVVYYDVSTGVRLVLKEPQGDVQVHLGTFIGLEERLQVLTVLLERLREEGKHYRFIDLSRPDEPILEP